MNRIGISIMTPLMHHSIQFTIVKRFVREVMESNRMSSSQHSTLRLPYLYRNSFIYVSCLRNSNSQSNNSESSCVSLYIVYVNKDKNNYTFLLSLSVSFPSRNVFFLYLHFTEFIICLVECFIDLFEN